MIQTFTVLGIAKGQGRPRACKRGQHAGMFKAKVDAQNETNIAAQVVAQKPVLIGQGVPVALTLEVYVPRPKLHFDSKGYIKDRFYNARPTSKPDVSNILKAIEDALNGIVWHDDSQIYRVEVERGYGDTPKTVIKVKSEAV